MSPIGTSPVEMASGGTWLATGGRAPAPTKNVISALSADTAWTDVMSRGVAELDSMPTKHAPKVPPPQNKRRSFVGGPV